MIKHVEHVGLEPQPESLIDGEIAVQGEIKFLQEKCPRDVAAEISWTSAPSGEIVNVESTRDGATATRAISVAIYTRISICTGKYSAVRFAGRVKTPVLFLHGEADQRVPSSQAEEFFRAIKHFGGTAELVLFPRESHMLPLTSEPKHLVEIYEWRLYWFDRWVKGDAQARRPEDAPRDVHTSE